MQANVILSKCAVHGSSYGIRVEQREDDWVSTWAFAIDDARASREGFDKVKIEGTLQPVGNFPGCPRCGAEGLMQCACGHMICHDEDREAKANPVCPWCKEEIGTISTVNTVEVSSGAQ
jgi:hypothetical protein